MDKSFDNICPRRYRWYSARTGCNINAKEWEISNNNLNVEINNVKNTVNKLQWEFENTSLKKCF
jgi:hypothetical protein